MRQLARRRCHGLDNVTVTSGPPFAGQEAVDLVTMVAALHHLDPEIAFRETKHILAPGGRLLVVGLAVSDGPRDYLWDATSVLTNPVIGYVTHPWPAPPSDRTPPHPVRDPTLSVREIRNLARRELPGAVLRRRVGFRYTLTWTKPQDVEAEPSRRR